MLVLFIALERYVIVAEVKAGVVIVSKFCESGNKQFTNYINYIDRDEAIRNDNMYKFNLYNDYMNNPEKTTGLFTADKDFLTDKEKKNYKDIFKKAEKNGSVLWQHVISFDNRWLEQQGIYDSQSKTINEIKMRNLTRIAMQKINKGEKLEASLWTAAIHLNTDNIHIHIAQVELIPAHKNADGEVRGKFKLSSLKSAKSAIVNDLIQNQPENKMINDIIRKNIVEVKRSNNMMYDDKFAQKFFDIYNKLPKNRQFWNYGSAKISGLIPQIDELSKYYLETYHAEDIKNLNELLNKQNEFYKTAYGIGNHNKNNYGESKKKDLYYRLGNALLKQMRDYSKNEENKNYDTLKNSNNSMTEHEFRKANSGVDNTQYALKNFTNLTRIFLKSEVIKFHDEISYELMQNEIEMNKREEQIDK